MRSRDRATPQRSQVDVVFHNIAFPTNRYRVDCVFRIVAGVNDIQAGFRRLEDIPIFLVIGLEFPGHAGTIHGQGNRIAGSGCPGFAARTGDGNKIESAVSLIGVVINAHFHIVNLIGFEFVNDPG